MSTANITPDFTEVLWLQSSGFLDWQVVVIICIALIVIGWIVTTILKQRKIG